MPKASAPAKAGALCRREPNHAHHQYHQLPTHGGNLRPRHRARTPLARRGRRARLTSALGLDGLRRPHRHSPHHGPCLGAGRVVDHRDEGISIVSTAPRPFGPGRGELQKIRARQWPRPICKFKAKHAHMLGSLSEFTASSAACARSGRVVSTAHFCSVSRATCVFLAAFT